MYQVIVTLVFSLEIKNLSGLKRGPIQDGKTEQVGNKDHGYQGKNRTSDFRKNKVYVGFNISRWQLYCRSREYYDNRNSLVIVDAWNVRGCKAYPPPGMHRCKGHNGTIQGIWYLLFL